MRGHNPVFSDNSILLAARNNFAGKQQQRTIGVIYI